VSSLTLRTSADDALRDDEVGLFNWRQRGERLALEAPAHGEVRPHYRRGRCAMPSSGSGRDDAGYLTLGWSRLSPGPPLSPEKVASIAAGAAEQGLRDAPLGKTTRANSASDGHDYYIHIYTLIRI